MQVRAALQQQYPWLEITFSNYPPPSQNVLLSQLLGAGQFVGLALTFAGERILPAVGFAELPPWYLRMQVRETISVFPTVCFEKKKNK